MGHAPDQFIARLLSFAQDTSNVLALIMTGSRARRGDWADRWSDYDIEIVCNDPGELETDDAWIYGLGDVWVYMSLRQDEGYATRLVFYEGGIKIDFTLADRRRIAKMVSDGLDGLFQRGYEVLLDKHSLTGELPAATGQPPAKSELTERDFVAAVEEFWFEAAHLPKYLARRELWVVKFRDWTMKEQLLKLLEWNAILASDVDVDVWHIGTDMKSWVDDQTWQELQAVFARFDVEDSWRGLFATARLFQRLQEEVAGRGGFGVPEGVRGLAEYVMAQGQISKGSDTED